MPTDSNTNTTGEEVAQLSFKARANGDCIDDKTFEEIVRRLEATIVSTQDSEIWSDLSEPTDKTLIWWPKDPTSGTRIGQPKFYDKATKTWIPVGGTSSGGGGGSGGGDGGTTTTRKRRNGQQAVVAGDSTVTIDFTDIGTTAYMITMTPYSPTDPPVNLNDFWFTCTSRANAQFVVDFHDVPGTGLQILWEVAEIAGAE